MRDEDVFAWDLLASILGDGHTSRLYREVKDKRGLVDSVSASSYTPKDPGMLMVGATGATKNAPEALREILVQVFGMAALPPEGNELPRAKTQTEGGFIYSLESQGSLAGHIGSFEVTLGDAAFEQKYLRKIREVTDEDIVRVAKKYLKPERLNVSVVVPPGDGGILPEAEIRKIGEEAWREAGARARAARGGGNVEVKMTGLENGIRVSVREIPPSPWWPSRRGSLRVCGGTRGEERISVMTAEMLTKGTKGRTAREISEAVENMAADLSAFSGRNSFGLQGGSCGRISSRGSACSPSPSGNRRSLRRSWRRNGRRSWAG
jgi:zinc protease